MLAQLTPRERFGYLAIAVCVLFGMGYVGNRYIAKPGPIVIQQQSGAPVAPTPDAANDSVVTSAANTVRPAKVIVHVAGAVKKPGVVELDGGARVQDAVNLAGGPVGADLESLNLAAKLVDGTQVYVPKKASPEDASKVVDAYKGGSDAPSPYSSRPTAAKSGKPAPSSISLNTSTASQLDALPGVGPATAEKIVDYRKGHGGFTSIDEILAVKGIGPKKLAAMRKYLRL